MWVSFTFVNLIEKARQYKDGIETLLSWLGSGGICVSQELAQERTNTCLKCEFNQSGSVITESIASAIKAQMELKNQMGLKTDGIKSLHSCLNCGCHLPLKIFIPLDKLGNTDEDLKKFPAHCWMKTEKAQYETNDKTIA